MRSHVDLFSGIGGWALAAHANGIQTIALCEIDEWLAQGLERAWGCYVHRDVRTFPAERFMHPWLLTASPPCQSASRAGKQRGAGDVRWLWPQTVAVCEILKPAWFCAENVAGLIDVGLDGILADLERLGYEVQPLSIPACAVDSPQDRERIWILGRGAGVGSKGCNRPELKSNRVAESTQDEPVADGASGRQKKSNGIEGNAKRKQQSDQTERQGCQFVSGGQFEKLPWSDYGWLPCPDPKRGTVLRRVPVGLYDLADGLRLELPKGVCKDLLQALGNSIVPQLAAEIIRAMIQAEP